MSKNVFFVCLNYGYAGKIANETALNCGKFFLDINELMEYSLGDLKRVKKLCGLEYLKKQQRKTLFDVKNYENTIANISYDFVIDEEYSELFNNSLVVFIKLERKELTKMNIFKTDDDNLNIELIVMEELNKLIESKATVVINSEGKMKKDIKTIQAELKKHKFGE